LIAKFAYAPKTKEIILRKAERLLLARKPPSYWCAKPSDDGGDSATNSGDG
jgi:hypothetical protein